MAGEGTGTGTGTGTGDGAGAGAAAGLPEWMGSLPTRLQASPVLTRFKTIEAVSDALLEARIDLFARPPKDAVIVPAAELPADASPEQKTAHAAQVDRFREHMGIPAAADGYQLSGVALDPARPEFVPNDAQKAAPDKVRAIAHELGLSQAQAERVTTLVVESLTENVTASAEQRRTHDEQVATALRTKYGAELDSLAPSIPGVYTVMMPDDEGNARLTAFLQREFHPGGVGNSQEMREVLMNLHRATKADRFVPGNDNPGQDAAPDPTRAKLDYSKGRGPVGVKYN